MRKSLFKVLGVTAALGAALLTTTAASAAPHARAAPAAQCPAGSTSCDTTVTFAVTSGAISISAPASGTLSNAAPGGTATGTLGSVVVTDDRAALRGSWTVSASSTDFTTGGSSGPETIPVGQASYDPGDISKNGTTGTSAPVGTAITLSATATPVVTSGTVNGNNIATWTPTEAVAVPSSVVAGTYTSTLTQSLT